MPLTKLSPRKRAKHIAYISQSHSPIFSFSCLDVVTMGRTAHMRYLQSPSQADKQAAYDALDYLGISWLAHKPYTEISGGQRQLVMIAAALTQDPELLILDEPTSHLDYGRQYKFLEVVQSLTEKNKGVIMTTHFPDHPLLLDSDILIMQNGRIGKRGRAQDLITSSQLEEIYGISIAVKEVDKRKLIIPFKDKITLVG